jgi:small-conductance mechanosensitive channel
MLVILSNVYRYYIWKKYGIKMLLLARRLPMAYRAFMLFLVLSIHPLAGNAQTISTPQDTTIKIATDSIEKKISEMESERIKDSLQKTELEAKLNALGNAEYEKRRQLEAALEALRSRDSLNRIKQKLEIDQLRGNTQGYAVIGPLNDTLFMIYNRVGSFTIAERAEAISQRIEKIGSQLIFQPDSMRVIEEENTHFVAYGSDFLIITVTDKDALWNHTTREALAESYKTSIINAIKRYKQETSFVNIAKEVGLALLVILFTGLIIYLILKGFRWINIKIQQQEGKYIKGIQLKNYTLFDSSRQVKVIQRIAIFFKWIIIFVLVYTALPLLFSIFPWTANIANHLTGYILNPIKKIGWALWDYLPNLFTIIILWIFFHYIQKIYHFLKDEIEKGHLKIEGFYPEWANPTFQIVRVLHYAFLFILIFPFLPGSESPIFKGVSVFLGFLFTFGSAGSLSNIIAGIVLTYMRQFTLGDRVKIGEVTGDVIEKSLLVTRIKTIKNEIISIPNTTVMSSHTINYSAEAKVNGLILHTTVTIGYDCPWRTVHEALLKAAEKTEDVLKEPKPFVLQTSLDDFYISYQLNVYSRQANNQSKVYSHLHQNIQDCCNEAGIEIMSPHYRALRDGNKTTIPEAYPSDPKNTP